MDRWAQSRCRPGSGLRATVQEPDDLGQLVKLSGFGFLPSEMGAIIYPCRAVICKEQKEMKCGKHPAPYLAAALV